MKVKKIALFEQGAYADAQYDMEEYEKNGRYKFTGNKIVNYPFDPQYQDDSAYVYLYRVGEDSILIEKVKAQGKVIYEQKSLMPSGAQDFENIRSAIETFDGLVRNFSPNWTRIPETIEDN